MKCIKCECNEEYIFRGNSYCDEHYNKRIENDKLNLGVDLALEFIKYPDGGETAGAMIKQIIRECRK